MNFAGLGSDPLGEIGLFAGATSRHDLDARLRAEVAKEVERILDLTSDSDAFDVIELLRLRAFPISPVLALQPDYDGSAAAVELVTLVLLTRGHRRAPGVDREKTRPYEVTNELHERARRLGRLGTYWTQAGAKQRGGGALDRLAADYQSYFAGVRGMQYDSVQAQHDRALFDRPEIEQLLVDHLGFTYPTFSSVRAAIQDVYSSRFTQLRDDTAEILMATESQARGPTEDEIAEFMGLMAEMMFLPGARAAFTVTDIADAAHLMPSTVEPVLRAFSAQFDATADPADVVMAFLRGRNPLATACLVQEGSDFVMTSSQIGSDSFRSVVEAALKPYDKAWQRYDRTRTNVSEQLTVTALERALSRTPIGTNLEYLAPKAGVGPTKLDAKCEVPGAIGEQVESDALFVIDDVAICVEVKGRSLAEAARRGDVIRLKREVASTIGSGAGQARRLEQLIRVNGGLWRSDHTWLDLSAVREVRTIVVGLDIFGPLGVALGQLDEAGLLGQGTLPWVTSLHDLQVVSDVLDRPAELLLYLRRRSDSGVAEHFRGADELDLFMLFLEGGLYVEPDPDEVHRGNPTTKPPKRRQRARYRHDAVPTYVGTHTDALDAWMYWIEGSSPDEVKKPAFNTHPAALDIVDNLAERSAPGWLRFGADLLGLSGQSQANLGRALEHIAKQTKTDQQPHSLVQGYAGLWGYPTFFAATSPDDEPIADSSARLLEYMTAKKHQVRSDRSLGLVLDTKRQVLDVIYLNNEPAADPLLDDLGADLRLAPTRGGGRRTVVGDGRQQPKRKRRKKGRR